MSSQISGILGKAEQDRRRGDFKKALKRLEDAIKKWPEDQLLYREAIDTALEAGESMRAAQYLKSAQRRSTTSDELWNFCRDKVEAYNDAILCKSMLDVSIKKRDLSAAEEVLDCLKDHTADQLLQRTRNKKQSLSAAGSDEFRIEFTTNSLAEALLHTRTKRFQEAAKGFIQIIDDKPVEADSVTPYLTSLQKRYPSKGSIRFALGCSCLASEDYERGLTMIVRGVELAPVNAADAIERIESLRTVNGVREERVELALAELSIFDEDDHDAAERLRNLMDSVPARNHEVLELLESHVEEIGNTPELNYLYLETALKKGEAERATRQIRCLNNDRREQTRLLDWLEERSGEAFITVDTLKLFGELALGQKDYEKSARAFRGALRKAPHEAHHIKDLVYPNRNEPVMQELYFELAGETKNQSTGGDGFSIEHYGGNDFTLDGQSDSGTEAPSAFEKEDGPVIDSTSKEDLSGFTDYSQARAEVLGDKPFPGTEDSTEEEPPAPVENGRKEEPPSAVEDARKEELSSAVEDGRKEEPPAAVEDGRKEEPRSAVEDGFERERSLDLSASVDELLADDTPTVIELGGETIIDSATEEGVSSEKERYEERRQGEPEAQDDFMDREPPELRIPDEPEDNLFQDLPEDAAPRITVDYSKYDDAGQPEAENKAAPATDDFDDRDTVLIEPVSSADDDTDSDITNVPIILGHDDEPASEDDVADRETTEDMSSQGDKSGLDLETQYENSEPTEELDTETVDSGTAAANGGNVIAAIEEAARLGQMKEMKELLKFEPRNDEEAIKRKLYLAEYYLHQDRPVSALVILRTMSVNDLGKEDRKTFLLKNAFCYQQLNRYDAAQGVYLRLMGEFPEFEAAEYMAHVNYQRHLQSSASGGQALEKVSSLQAADKKEEEQ